jgi:hypothetical protein
MSGNPYFVPSFANRPTSSAVLGGPYNGYSPVQTINAFNNSDQGMDLMLLVLLMVVIELLHHLELLII